MEQSQHHQQEIDAGHAAEQERSQADVDEAFAAQQAEVEAAEQAALNGVEPLDKQAFVRKLANDLSDRIREIMYDGGKLQRMKVEDPGTVEEFWRLQDRLDEWLALYMEGKIPRDTSWEYEALQIPGGPKVKALRIKPGDTLMDAARDLFIYIALL